MITILTRCWLLFIDALVYQSSKGNSMATETKELCLGQKKTCKNLLGAYLSVIINLNDIIPVLLGI